MPLCCAFFNLDSTEMGSSMASILVVRALCIVVSFTFQSTQYEKTFVSDINRFSVHHNNYSGSTNVWRWVGAVILVNNPCWDAPGDSSTNERQDHQANPLLHSLLIPAGSS